MSYTCVSNNKGCIEMHPLLLIELIRCCRHPHSKHAGRTAIVLSKTFQPWTGSIPVQARSRWHSKYTRISLIQKVSIRVSYPSHVAIIVITASRLDNSVHFYVFVPILVPGVPVSHGASAAHPVFHLASMRSLIADRPNPPCRCVWGRCKRWNACFLARKTR